jgi:ribonucleoside-diphosphate reductase beta chain
VPVRLIVRNLQPPAGSRPMASSLLTPNAVYKPFRYPWAYEAWLMQQRIHWLPEEVPLADDVKDWRNKLTDSERNLLTQIFRFFTQADVEVNNCYMKRYARVFQPTEVQMMLSAFSNIETVHIAAYSHLLDTIGMPETEYSAFLRYKAMKDKYDYMQEFSVDSPAEIAKTLAVFGAFTEGLQLFASFAILLNFPRFNKMKGMGQIVSWSARDESLHTQSVIRLFRTFVGRSSASCMSAATPSWRMRTPSSIWHSKWAASRG